MAKVFTDNYKCPTCAATENIYWYGHDTSHCLTCGYIGKDETFTDAVSAHEANQAYALKIVHAVTDANHDAGNSKLVFGTP